MFDGQFGGSYIEMACMIRAHEFPYPKIDGREGNGSRIVKDRPLDVTV